MDSKSDGGLPLQQPELPAVTALPDAHVRRRAVRVADLVHAVPLVQLGVAGEVEDQPALLEPQVLHGRRRWRCARHCWLRRSPARSRARTDSCSPVSRSVKSTRTRSCPSCATSVTSTLPCRRTLVWSLRLVRSRCSSSGWSNMFAAGMAVAAALGRSVEGREDPVVPVDQLQAQGRSRHGGELLSDPDPGQDAVDLVVQVDRPGLRVDAVPAVQDQALHAVLAEQGGGGDADRTRSHDDDRNRIGAGAPRRAHRTLISTTTTKATATAPRTRAGASSRNPSPLRR